MEDAIATLQRLRPDWVVVMGFDNEMIPPPWKPEEVEGLHRSYVTGECPTRYRLTLLPTRLLKQIHNWVPTAKLTLLPPLPRPSMDHRFYNQRAANLDSYQTLNFAFAALLASLILLQTRLPTGNCHWTLPTYCRSSTLEPPARDTSA